MKIENNQIVKLGLRQSQAQSTTFDYNEISIKQWLTSKSLHAQKRVEEWGKKDLDNRENQARVQKENRLSERLPRV